jgi:hypothetical protein
MNIPKHCFGRLGAGSLSVAAALVVTTSAGADDRWIPLNDGWTRYTNQRYGTIVDVPRHLFKLVEPPPINGDGREFTAEDGASLRVFGTYAPYFVTSNFQEYKAWLLEETKLDRIAYKAEGEDWLVLSGTRGASIVYRQVIERCGAAHEFRIEYPAAKKNLYDFIVARLSRSLSCTAASPLRQ